MKAYSDATKEQLREARTAMIHVALNRGAVDGSPIGATNISASERARIESGSYPPAGAAWAECFTPAALVLAGRSLRRGALAILVILGATVGMPPSVTGTEMVTEAAIRAVITAIEDEIYANGYYTAYIDVGADRVPVYVNPRVENGMVWVIYKLMPYGEIRRGAVLSADKQLAMLQRDPHLGFPASDGSATKTVYLRDEDVIEMKTTWRKAYMSIELKPSDRRIEEATRREAIRYKDRR